MNFMETENRNRPAVAFLRFASICLAARLDLRPIQRTLEPCNLIA
jgi:hypothetical protein